jgi:hypothetical protein
MSWSLFFTEGECRRQVSENETDQESKVAGFSKRMNKRVYLFLTSARGCESEAGLIYAEVSPPLLKSAVKKCIVCAKKAVTIQR